MTKPRKFIPLSPEEIQKRDDEETRKTMKLWIQRSKKMQ